MILQSHIAIGYWGQNVGLDGYFLRSKLDRSVLFKGVMKSVKRALLDQTKALASKSSLKALILALFTIALCPDFASTPASLLLRAHSHFCLCPRGFLLDLCFLGMGLISFSLAPLLYKVKNSL